MSDDDLTFNRNVKSNLGSMFNDSEASKKADFSTKRPKQQDSAQQSPKPGSVSNVFAVAGIYLYKADANGELVLANESALGAALLFDQSRYFLYVYKTKSEPILSLYFNSKFTLEFADGEDETVFAYFQDDKRHQWSIQFESFAVAKKFALAVSVVINLYKPDELYTMEMNQGTGGELDDGDTAGIFYEGYGVDKNKVGTQFGSSDALLKVTLGSGTCIRGLEQGLAGMKKAGQRIIVVPPALADRRLEPNPPSGIPLVFFVTVDRVRITKKATPAKQAEKANDLFPLPSLGELPAVADAKPKRKNTKASAATVDSDDEGESERQKQQQKQQVQQQIQQQLLHQQQQQAQQQAQQLAQQAQQQQQAQQFQQGNQNLQVNPFGVPQANQYGASQALVPHQPGQVQPGQIQYDPYTGQPYQVPQSPYHPPVQQQPTPQAPPTTAPSNVTATSVNDHVQLLVEERQYKGQIDTKINSMLQKVDRLTDQVGLIKNQRSGNDAHTSSGISAKALLSTITRIVSDNERLHSETVEKTKQLTAMRDELNRMRNEKQSVVEENTSWVETRTKNFQEFTLAHKKKLDAVSEEKEQLLITIADLQAQEATQRRKTDTIRKQYQSLTEEFKQLQQDNERNTEAKNKARQESDSAISELNNFKQKYREENRKMTEAVTEVERLTHELNVANNKLDAQAQKMKDIAATHLVELQKLDTAHQEERNSLIEENNQLKNLYRQNMQLAKAKIEEMEAEFEESKRQEKEKWRAYVNEELQRRVEAAVAETITIEQSKHDIALAQALAEQKDLLLTEKDHELIVQKEDFQTQLAIEVSNAREEGKNAGLTEAREEGVKIAAAEFERGTSEGFAAGKEEGTREGTEAGHKSGYEQGQKAGYEDGMGEGVRVTAAEWEQKLSEERTKFQEQIVELEIDAFQHIHHEEDRPVLEGEGEKPAVNTNDTEAQLQPETVNVNTNEPQQVVVESEGESSVVEAKNEAVVEQQQQVASEQPAVTSENEPPLASANEKATGESVTATKAADNNAWDDDSDDFFNATAKKPVQATVSATSTPSKPAAKKDTIFDEESDEDWTAAVTSNKPVEAAPKSDDADIFAEVAKPSGEPVVVAEPVKDEVQATEQPQAEVKPEEPVAEIVAEQPAQQEEAPVTQEEPAKVEQEEPVVQQDEVPQQQPAEEQPQESPVVEAQPEQPEEKTESAVETQPEQPEEKTESAVQTQPEQPQQDEPVQAEPEAKPVEPEQPQQDEPVQAEPEAKPVEPEQQPAQQQEEEKPAEVVAETQPEATVTATSTNEAADGEESFVPEKKVDASPAKKDFAWDEDEMFGDVPKKPVVVTPSKPQVTENAFPAPKTDVSDLFDDEVFGGASKKTPSSQSKAKSSAAADLFDDDGDDDEFFKPKATLAIGDDPLGGGGAKKASKPVFEDDGDEFFS